MARITPDPRAARLLEPVGDLLARAAARLPAGPALAVGVGAVDGYARHDRDQVVLSDALEGPALHHPDEVALLPPLDRWRRAAASVLEGLARAALAATSGAEPVEDWRWVGAAIHAAHAAAPELGTLAPALATARSTGDLGRFPRAGAAVFETLALEGEDPWSRAISLVGGQLPDLQEWAALGRRVLGPGFGGAALVAVAAVHPVDIPVELGPWRWQTLRVPAHRRGGLVVVQGDGAVDDPWAVGRRPLVTLAATREGCSLVPEVGGPVGTWDLASSRSFSRIHGARGVRFVLHGSGAVDLVLADAFVGPVEALDMASQVGTSGTARGRWRVAGPQKLYFDDLRGVSMTFHDRAGDVVVPQGGLGGALSELCAEAWTWRLDGRRLLLDGVMFGGPVHLRLEPVGEG